MDEQVLDECNRVGVQVGLPTGVIAALSVEAARCVERVAWTRGVAENDVRAELDGRAREGLAIDLLPSTSLAAYASALLRGGETLGGRPGAGRLELAVTVRVATMWAVEARRAGLDPDDWVTEKLRSVRSGPELWEAAAASNGETMAEWAFSQALSL